MPVTGCTADIEREVRSGLPDRLHGLPREVLGRTRRARSRATCPLEHARARAGRDLRHRLGGHGRADRQLRAGPRLPRRRLRLALLPLLQERRGLPDVHVHARRRRRRQGVRRPGRDLQPHQEQATPTGCGTDATTGCYLSSDGDRPDRSAIARSWPARTNTSCYDLARLLPGLVCVDVTGTGNSLCRPVCSVAPGASDCPGRDVHPAQRQHEVRLLQLGSWRIGSSARGTSILAMATGRRRPASRVGVAAPSSSRRRSRSAAATSRTSPTTASCARPRARRAPTAITCGADHRCSLDARRTPPPPRTRGWTR